MKNSIVFYHRHLPHYQPEGERYHVVFRLAGSIPASVLEELQFQREQEEKRIADASNAAERNVLLQSARWQYFDRIEKLLDGNVHGPFWLRKAEIADIVDEAIRYRDGKEYDLIAYSIMPNHVHTVFTLLHKENHKGPVCRTDCPTYTVSGSSGQARYFQYSLTNILRKLKWNTALKANRVLNRSGTFWHGESYDHVIRDDNELDRTVEYVLMNPVKAGLCNNWRDWRWTYVKSGYAGD